MLGPERERTGECINGTMKSELLSGKFFSRIDAYTGCTPGRQLRQSGYVHNAVRRAVCFYNMECPRMILDMMTPAQDYMMAGEQMSGRTFILHDFDAAIIWSKQISGQVIRWSP